MATGLTGYHEVQREYQSGGQSAWVGWIASPQPRGCIRTLRLAAHVIGDRSKVDGETVYLREFQQ